MRLIEVISILINIFLVYLAYNLSVQAANLSSENATKRNAINKAVDLVEDSLKKSYHSGRESLNHAFKDIPSKHRSALFSDLSVLSNSLNTLYTLIQGLDIPEDSVDEVFSIYLKYKRLLTDRDDLDDRKLQFETYYAEMYGKLLLQLVKL